MAAVAPRVPGVERGLLLPLSLVARRDRERLNHALRSRLRQRGRSAQALPTAGCLDSQSVKGTAVPGPRGYDAGKKVNRRKRHLLVDTLGLLLAVVVTAARVLLLARLPGGCKKLRKVWVDGGYMGTLVDWVAARFQFCLAVVPRPKESRVRAAAPALGGGAHLPRLAEPLAPPGARARAAHPDGRGLGIHRHDPHHVGRLA